jgi:hypothetical protein
MADVGVRWGDFETAAPEIALAGRRLLEDRPGVPGAAFLATVGSDGRPRIHPFVPAIVERRLWAFVIDSPKQRDLDRDGGYAIHSLLGADDESCFIGGTAIRADDREHRTRVAERMPYSDIDARHVVYEFRIDRALWTVWHTPTSPVHRNWRLTSPRIPAAR